MNFLITMLIKKKINYNIYCINYDKFFDNIENFNKTFNLKNIKSLYPIKKENYYNKNIKDYIVLNNIYKKLINIMDNKKFIEINYSIKDLKNNIL